MSFSQVRQYLTSCATCGQRTSKAYAKSHNGNCKLCTTGESGRKADRSYPCPDCGTGRISAYQKERGYHCDSCTRETDPVGWAREVSMPYEPEY